jgi:hypothetical protein
MSCTSSRQSSSPPSSPDPRVAARHDSRPHDRQQAHALTAGGRLPTVCQTSPPSRLEVSPRIAGHLVDFVWREQRLVAELDSWGFHSTKRAFETDRDRDADLLTEGFRTIRITFKRLEQNAKKEAERLRALLR